MKIITWNIDGLRSTLAAGAFEPIRQLEPDVLCLQEIRTDTQPSVLEGWHHCYNSAKRAGYAGTAVVSREPALDMRPGLGDAELDAEGRVITAEYGSFFLVTAYVPRSLSGLRRQGYRVRFDAALLEHVGRLERSKPVVLCGDFNAVLDDNDVYEENVHHGELAEGFATDDRDLLLALLDMGYVDAFRHVHPDAQGAYTWWSRRRARRAVNRGWRLDYFFVSEGLADKVCDVWHLAEVSGSDHCPVMLTVDA